MIAQVPANLAEMLGQVIGYIYPNEVEIHWSILIVVYPYLTGLVAGAFILASLVKVFNVKEVQPTYRLALLTALSFLLVAPFPLLLHLGHMERSFEIFLAPHLSSAMAMFGFVYAWYLMASCCSRSGSSTGATWWCGAASTPARCAGSTGRSRCSRTTSATGRSPSTARRCG